MGGDVAPEKVKDFEDGEVITFKEGLTEMVKAVSIAHRLGKSLKDF